MKGLIKFLSPFAPDQSGASGVLYGLGGLIVVCDAGGCTGNICGFDEPRWFLRNTSPQTPVLAQGKRPVAASVSASCESLAKDTPGIRVLDPGSASCESLAKDTPGIRVLDPGSASCESLAKDTPGIRVLDPGSASCESLAQDTPGVILSAGLRDMDAILGRDDQLVGKLQSALEKLGSPFAALIGTPVPAVIGTDFPALRRMAERRCKVPVLGIPCTGTGLYDEGEETAYLALFQRFSRDTVSSFKKGDNLPESFPVDSSKNTASDTAKGGDLPEGLSVDTSKNTEFGIEKGGDLPDGLPTDSSKNSEFGIVRGRLGILGATPLNLGTAKPFARLAKALGTKELLCYGTAGGLSAIALAPTAEKNLVVAPSGLAAAKLLEEHFGTPYEVCYPLLEANWPEACDLPDDAFREDSPVPTQTESRPQTDDLHSDASQGRRASAGTAAASGRDFHSDAPQSHRASAGTAAASGRDLHSDALQGRRALVIHQQVLANEARKRLLAAGCAQVTVATFFHLEKELAEEGDLHLSEESELAELLQSGQYDLVAGDRYLARCARNFNGLWIHLPHFAVSGECEDI